IRRIAQKNKKNDIIISTEISRLGRNIMELMGILHTCLNKNCQVWTIKDGYRLKKDLQSKVLAIGLGLVSEVERTLISQRTKEALARAKSEGKILGRPKGSKYLSFRKQIKELLKNGKSRTEIAILIGISKVNVCRVMSYSPAIF
ncbi:MAG: recombinase family protein, partial [Fibromonadales bacterium]|nr:recombinase family protein [Fibromonadales bacterium]